jgi:hypothetical protein
MAPFPVEDSTVSLLVAWSVFTHLTQDQCEYYLREASRVLRPDGVMFSTWFLFDKSVFPMMQDFQNTLYISYTDPANATIFDGTWLVELASNLGLTVRSAALPEVRGFSRKIEFTPTRPGVVAVELPVDNRPLGRRAPPIGRANPSAVGLD